MSKDADETYKATVWDIHKHPGRHRVHIDGSPYHMDQRLFNKLVRKGTLVPLEAHEVPGYWNDSVIKISQLNTALKEITTELAEENAALKRIIHNITEDE